MAKIDTTKIEGYAEMSAEEKLAALESFEYEDKTEDYAKLKKSFDKTSSEVAEWKKKHNALLTDEERQKQEAEASIKAMQTELETLRRDKTVAGHKAKYLAMGYEESLAEETAAALADGNLDVVFANQAKHQEASLKKLKSETMRGNPTPPAGAGSVGVDYAKLISEAQSRGDFVTAAAYMRKQQESIK